MELLLWYNKWKMCTAAPLPNTLRDSLKKCAANFFPNLKILLKILCTIPITSCQCERSISSLRRLKTWNRSTMKADRLNGLALMHCHYDLKISADKIVERFCKKHPRKMELENLFVTDL